jgi:hypothetical protein
VRPARGVNPAAASGSNIVILSEAKDLSWNANTKIEKGNWKIGANLSWQAYFLFSIFAFLLSESA